MKIPDIPQSWHYLGLSKDFKDAPVAVKLQRLEFAVYRDSKGKLHAMSGNCPHMGAKLACGKVKNDRLVCPFHEWEFGSDGVCAKIPSQTEIPAFAKLQTFPVVERHGIAFLFYGTEPTFELPFFPGVDADDFFPTEPVEIHQKGRWYIVPANAFDIPHLIHVHKRIPVTAPEIRSLHEYSRSIHHHYQIADSTWIDRLIRALFGSEARLHFTVWGGNFTLITTEFGRFKNHMLAVLEPVAENFSKTVIFVYSPNAKRGPIYRFFKGLLLKFQAVSSRRFFQTEADSLLNVEINPATLIQSDQLLKDYLEWLKNLSI